MAGQGEYSYILGFPVSAPNIVWLGITTLLTTTYIFNYVISPSGVLGKVFQYLVQYGKAKSSTDAFDLPKRFFTHYYVVATAWNLACFLTVVGLCFGFTQRNWISQVWGLQHTQRVRGDQLSILIVLFIITIHSMKRLYECVAVSVFSSKGKINVIQYIWGFMYYLLLAPTLISENLPLQELPFGSIETRHVVGIVLFVVASFIHHQTHILLANMRKKGAVKQDSHGIPQGGMFALVSCPHYFAEVLLYVATMVIMGSQCRSWWLVLAYNVVTHANMGVSAHLWYRKTFPSYPKQRKAFIPFLL